MTETVNLKHSAFTLKETSVKPEVYKYLRNYQFSIMAVSGGLYRNTGHLLGTFSYDVL